LKIIILFFQSQSQLRAPQHCQRTSLHSHPAGIIEDIESVVATETTTALPDIEVETTVAEEETTETGEQTTATEEIQDDDLESEETDESTLTTTETPSETTTIGEILTDAFETVTTTISSLFDLAADTEEEREDSAETEKSPSADQEPGISIHLPDLTEDEEVMDTPVEETFEVDTALEVDTDEGTEGGEIVTEEAMTEDVSTTKSEQEIELEIEPTTTKGPEVVEAEKEEISTAESITEADEVPETTESVETTTMGGEINYDDPDDEYDEYDPTGGEYDEYNPTNEPPIEIVTYDTTIPDVTTEHEAEVTVTSEEDLLAPVEGSSTDSAIESETESVTAAAGQEVVITTVATEVEGGDEISTTMESVTEDSFEIDDEPVEDVLPSTTENVEETETALVEETVTTDGEVEFVTSEAFTNDEVPVSVTESDIHEIFDFTVRGQNKYLFKLQYMKYFKLPQKMHSA
jgi:hypothetical protein